MNEVALVQDVSALAATASAQLRTTRVLLNNNAADLSALSSEPKTSIVDAINALRAALTSVATTAGSAAIINDTASTASTSAVWSPQRVSSFVSTQIANALEGTDLSDLADAVAALAQADNGLLSFTTAQTLTPAQVTTIRTNIQIIPTASNFAQSFLNGLV